MKLIGHKENGDAIIECTSQEYRTLCMSAELAKGRPLNYPEYQGNQRLDADQHAVLDAIHEWLEVKDKANALRNLEDRIDEAIKVDPKTDVRSQ